MLPALRVADPLRQKSNIVVITAEDLGCFGEPTTANTCDLGLPTALQFLLKLGRREFAPTSAANPAP